MGIIDDVIDDDDEEDNRNRGIPKRSNSKQQKRINDEVSSGLNITQIIALIAAVALICGGMFYVINKPCPDLTCTQANLTCPLQPDCVCNSPITYCNQTIIIPNYGNYTNGTWSVNNTQLPYTMNISLRNTTYNNNTVIWANANLTNNTYVFRINSTQLVNHDTYLDIYVTP
jgi:uncharacterized membrane protein